MSNEEIILGSGKLYIAEFTGEIPEDAIIETEANNLGAVQGGASFEYKPKTYDVTDDAGIVKKTFIIEEEAILKSGVLTWNGNTLKKVCSTARVTEDSTKKIRTVKIGGINNQDGKEYIIRFVHTSGKIKLTMVGQNQSGFSLKFLKDKETVTDIEFKALPNDGEGTLVIYTETIEAAV